MIHRDTNLTLYNRICHYRYQKQLKFRIFRSTREFFQTKKIIQTLIEAHISRKSNCTFDDFVMKKKLNLIILLQYDFSIFFTNLYC